MVNECPIVHLNTTVALQERRKAVKEMKERRIMKTLFYFGNASSLGLGAPPCFFGGWPFHSFSTAGTVRGGIIFLLSKTSSRFFIFADTMSQRAGSISVECASWEWAGW